MKWPVIDETAPAERLAAWRIVAGTFTLGYLLLRFPVFVSRNGRSDDAFDGIGILGPLDSPPATWLLGALVVVGVVSGLAVVVGARFRVAVCTFALTLLLLTTARSSWGQLLHFEHLMVLHLLVLAVSPAADVWSWDARRRRSAADVGRAGRRDVGSSVRYGWPLGVAGLVTVVTYVIAGIAKLRYGGWDWIAGDTLRNHIAYSAARLELIGGDPAPLAAIAVRVAWILPVFAAASVVVELTAPLVWVGGRVRTVWVVAAWLMHAAIFATMYVGFPSPLFGVAFAPFFRLERLVRRVAHTVGRLGSVLTGRPPHIAGDPSA